MRKSELFSFLGIASNIQNPENLVWVWNEAVKDQYQEIDEKVILITNEAYNEGVKLSKGKLPKPIWSYKMIKKITCPAIIAQEQEALRLKQEKEKLKKEEELKKQQMIREWELECDRLGYPTYNWLDSNGIVYYTKEPAIRYYWSLIGNNFKYKKGGDLVIRDDIEKIILDTNKYYGLKGQTFLNRTFKNSTNSWAKAHRISGVYSENDDFVEKDGDYGVYGIYLNEELIYVGMTMKGFSRRWKEHEQIFKGAVEAPLNMILYKNKIDFDKLVFKRLFTAKDALVEGTLTRHDIEVIELAYITAYKPKYNWIGVHKKYSFSGEPMNV